MELLQHNYIHNSGRQAHPANFQTEIIAYVYRP